jgi:hypothetical protein
MILDGGKTSWVVFETEPHASNLNEGKDKIVHAGAENGDFSPLSALWMRREERRSKSKRRKKRRASNGTEPDELTKLHRHFSGCSLFNLILASGRFRDFFFGCQDDRESSLYLLYCSFFFLSFRY